MRFSWTGLLLAPLLVPLLMSAATFSLFGGNNPTMLFLLLLVAGGVVSYGTTIFLFLPSLLILSRIRPLTGFRVCLLGLALGMLAFVLVTWMEWKSSGPDSGPPTESFFAFLPRWAADPLTAIYPIAGFVTAGLYWWLGTRTWRRSGSALG